jgi:hypothetical protein
MHEVYIMCKCLLFLYPRMQRAEPSGVSALSRDYTDSIHEIREPDSDPGEIYAVGIWVLWPRVCC